MYIKKTLKDFVLFDENDTDVIKHQIKLWIVFLWRKDIFFCIVYVL